MERQMRQLLIFLLIPIFLILPLGTRAAGEPRLRLSPNKLDPVSVGQEVTIALLVENAPLIYGVESHLAFDPTILEAIELKHGDFLSPHPATETFILQNQVDNQIGAIDYALALLNPAPPVSGNGQLATITFRVKAAGSTTIEVKETLFGTQLGEEISPLVEGAQLFLIATSSHDQPAAEVNTIGKVPALAQPPTDSTEEISAAPEESNPRPRRLSNETNTSYDLWLGISLLSFGVIGLMSLVGLGGLLGGWFLIAWASRRKKAPWRLHD